MRSGGNSRRAGVLAALLALGLLGGAHAGAAGAAPETAGGGTLVIGKSFDLVTMDPGRMFETTGGIIIPAMYDTLLTFENNDVTEPVAGLATSWEVNEDATEFTFTLRDDAVFSDGSPVERGRRRLLAEPRPRAEGQRFVPHGGRHRRGRRRRQRSC